MPEAPSQGSRLEFLAEASSQGSKLGYFVRSFKPATGTEKPYQPDPSFKNGLERKALAVVNRRCEADSRIFRRKIRESASYL